MGSYKEERYVTCYKLEKSTVKKACIACLASFLISMVGGLVLGWWKFKYHPTNSQLWMVPFGLILFVTPVIVGLSVSVSHLRHSKLRHRESVRSGASSPSHPKPISSNNQPPLTKVCYQVSSKSTIMFPN
uniref:Transmembrane protein n=1 Tax=Davidia involucrata TaxID=16924 RepID=A0A5B7CAY8_DAVIN